MGDDAWLDFAIILAFAAIFLRIGHVIGRRSMIPAVFWLDRLAETQRSVILIQRAEIARLRARSGLPLASRMPESSIN